MIQSYFPIFLFSDFPISHFSALKPWWDTYLLTILTLLTLLIYFTKSAQGLGPGCQLITRGKRRLTLQSSLQAYRPPGCMALCLLTILTCHTYHMGFSENILHNVNTLLSCNFSFVYKPKPSARLPSWRSHRIATPRPLLIA